MDKIMNGAEKLPRVVIIGAGFGGLWAARALSGAPVKILLVDRNNYHTFTALLYQVAAAELGPDDIVHPIRNILRDLSNVQVEMAEVKNIDTGARQIITSDRHISYDYLIVAAGSETAFFGIPGASKYAYPLKTLEDSIKLRNNILKCFEKAVYEKDTQTRKKLLTFTVIGGGPTGIEIAGALMELVRGPLKKDFKNLDLEDVKINLIEATDNLLPGFIDYYRNYSNSRLQQIGVRVYTKSPVIRITKHSVLLENGRIIPTNTVIWVAGVNGASLAQKSGFELAHNGRVKVLPTLQLKNHPEVYIVGDLAYIEENDKPLQMVAPVAIQQAVNTAENIKRAIKGERLKSFHYKDPGYMVIIGRNNAIARIKNRTFTGFTAWILWLIVHILRLVGFRNRLLVIIGWAMDYFFYERGVRIILPPESLKD